MKILSTRDYLLKLLVVFLTTALMSYALVMLVLECTRAYGRWMNLYN